MPKQKIHISAKHVTVNPEDYQSILKRAVWKLPKDGLAEVVLALSRCDLTLQAQFIARIVPLSMDDTVAFLQKVIEVARRGRNILHADSQEEICKVTHALIEKAKDQIGSGDLIIGACICFAIIKVIEPEITHVADEGYILQRIICDAFDVLRGLPGAGGGAQEFSVLALMAGTVLSEMAEDDRHYEEDWRGIVRMYQGTAFTGRFVGLGER